LRGTCLSWLANTDTPLKVLQDFARHGDPRLTMNLYAKRLSGSLGAAAPGCRICHARIVRRFGQPARTAGRPAGPPGKAHQKAHQTQHF